jgi:hypothetical protein
LARAIVTSWDAFEAGDNAARVWSLCCAMFAHVLLAVLVLTAKLPDPVQPNFQVVELVTLNEAPAVAALAPESVEKRTSILGPKPTDRRQSRPDAVTPDIVPDPPVPLELPIDQLRAPTKPPVLATPPLSVPALEPLPTPKVLPPLPQIPVPVPEPAPAPEPLPDEESAPPPPVLPQNITASSVTIAPSRARNEVRLNQPTGNALAIGGAKLKLPSAPAVQAAPLKPVPEVLPLQAPTPIPAPTPPMPKIQRLNLPPSRLALPKVQVPRVEVPSLPETAEAADTVVAAPPAPPSSLNSGVTAVTSTQVAAQSGQSRASGPVASGGGATGNSGTGSNGVGSGSDAGSVGVLPRRPLGSGVRTPFPRGNGDNLLEQMDETFDCSRFNPERDARCPQRVPIEGATSRGGNPLPVPVPKDLPKQRYPIGTNPMPVCPPGTRANQFGLSCLPIEEGPGIPKP